MNRNIKRWATILVVVFFAFPFTFSTAQGQADSVPATGDLPPIDEGQFADSSRPDLGPEPDMGPESEGDAGIQNAVIEGVQISSEPGDRSDEKVISCYFIFRDKPSSYFYEVKLKEKKIIFEFNDTKSSAAPIPSTAEAPVTGFVVDQRKVDINKDVKGLKPEYHSQVRVVFNLSAVPEIHVNDEYNVISYSYKWTTDSSKLDKYILKPAKIWPWLVGGTAGLIGGGAAAYLKWGKPPALVVEKPIPTDGLPEHTPP
jgi:hypothetical protein